VNCVSYYHGGERPYLVSGGDDRSVRVWDYQNKACVQVLTGHTHNVSAVEFHPSLPVLLSGGEDGSIRVWNSSTYRLIKTLHYRMERVWAVACMKTSNKVEMVLLCR
jgi:coatomer subunit beta'